MIIPDVLILLASIRDTKKGIKLRGKNDSIAQLVKALACHAKGPKFQVLIFELFLWNRVYISVHTTICAELV